jgi:trans-2,3-dihydro-3-hydroxyanthranilate isomerase
LLVREIDIYQVDAFTDVLFGGNPAGVVPDAQGLSDDTMQKIAREMNLSETAFVLDTRGSGRADFDVRFFTPLSEVDLCGHATIGAFYLLAEIGIISSASADVRVTQETKAGVLPVDIEFGCEGIPSRVMMTQNVPSVVTEPTYQEIVELEKILGAPQGSITGFRRARPQVISTGLPDLITPVTSREALLSMRPDMSALTDFCNDRHIISVHCFSLETIHPASTVHCRDFSPAVGVPEESATGTASGATGGYLVLNGLVEVAGPVTRIVCEQGHILKRPSIIHVEVSSEGRKPTGIRVGGSAVSIIKGRIKVSQ